MSLANPTPIDWHAPDYRVIYAERERRLLRIRNGEVELEPIRDYYRDHIPQFINDWGVTIDPRNIPKGLPAIMPFTLFAKQIAWLEWLQERWRAQEPGITEKSRDMGISWLAMAFSVSQCLFNRNVQIGFGSAKEDKVDRSGDPDTLFYKGRMFLQYLPVEFRGNWDLRRNSAHMRLLFPATESSVTGEAGDNIGRGGRSTLYFVDEAAHLERPALVDAALVANTDCRQDMSSVKGTANTFAERRHSGNVKVFTFHYVDDPRKSEAWVTRKRAETDPVIWAQEYEIDYTASVEGIVIPAAWVTAAIDAHIKLGLKPTGEQSAALDVGDLGPDKNAMAFRHGCLLTDAVSFSGKTSDLFQTSVRAFFECETHGLDRFCYDADGLGASVRGDAKRLNEDRAAKKQKPIRVTAFRGSGSVLDPTLRVQGTDRTNEDFFENYKAQCWWLLRFRFQATYNWVVHGIACNPSDIISISKDFAERTAACRELSQPVSKLSKSGKVMIDKVPDGVPSPNLGDSIMMVFAPRRTPMEISDDLLIQSAAMDDPAR